jgi:hypothetical protein
MTMPRCFTSIACVSAAALVAVLVAVVVYRAATQSIVYDEAFTYLAFLSGPPSLVFTSYTANNHVLLSVLSRFSIALFGVSEFAIRLPSVLSAVLYFGLVLALCRLVFGTGYLFLATVAAVSLNPFILDLLIAARGYGLALALFMAGLYQLTRCLLGDSEEFDRRWLVASVALALSVCANLAFLFAAAALVCAAIAIDVFRRTRTGSLDALEYVRVVLLWIVAPGVLVAAAVLMVPLSAARSEHFFFGAPALAETLYSLLTASLNHSAAPWTSPDPQLETMNRILAWFVVVPLFVGFGFVAVGTLRRRGSGPPDRVATFLALVSATLALTLLFLISTRWLFDVQYPSGRTGLYFIVLFVLGMASLARYLEHRVQPAARTAAAVIFGLLILLVGRFATEFDTRYFYDWRFDAGSRDMFDAVAGWPDRREGAPVRIAASASLFAESLEFYRVVRGGHRIGSIAQDWHTHPSAYDFFIVSPGSDLELARRYGDVVYVHPVSGAALLVNSTRHSAR